MRAECFIIVSEDPATRASLNQIFGSMGYAVPLEHLAEMGSQWPEQAWVIIEDSGDLVDDSLKRLGEMDRYYAPIIFTQTPDIDRIVHLLHNGVLGFFEWPCDEAKIRNVIETLRGIAQSRALANADRMLARQKLSCLSKRERQVLKAVADGHSNKEIARQFEISPRTVESYRANSLQKLGVSNGFEAARLIYNAETIGIAPGFAAGSSAAA